MARAVDDLRMVSDSVGNASHNSAILAEAIRSGIEVNLQESSFDIAPLPDDVRGNFLVKNGTLRPNSFDTINNAQLGDVHISNVRLVSGINHRLSPRLILASQVERLIVDQGSILEDMALIQSNGGFDSKQLVVQDSYIRGNRSRVINMEGGCFGLITVKNNHATDIHNTVIYIDPSPNNRGKGKAVIKGNVCENDPRMLMTGSGSYLGFGFIGRIDECEYFGNSVSGLVNRREGTQRKGVIDIFMRARSGIYKSNICTNCIQLDHTQVNNIINQKSAGYPKRFPYDPNFPGDQPWGDPWSMSRVISQMTYRVDEWVLRYHGVDLSKWGVCLYELPISWELDMVRMSEISVDVPGFMFRREVMRPRVLHVSNFHVQSRRAFWMHPNASLFAVGGQRGPISDTANVTLDDVSFETSEEPSQMFLPDSDPIFMENGAYHRVSLNNIRSNLSNRFPL